MAKHSVNWPCPANVVAVYSDRVAGVSQVPFDSYNLGDHVGDELAAVNSNRANFQMSMPEQVCWLKQVHSTRVVDASDQANVLSEADASIAASSGAACVVMTADCLPVLFCDLQGTVVAAAHAGWRGLVDGVLEKTVAKMQVEPQQLMAWMGPAIGPQAFEVGAEVKQRFVQHNARAASAFTQASQADKYYADIFTLAEQRLQALGIGAIYSERICTYSHPQHYFSYRREGQTGRMAAAIWLSE
ncbi:peptidoglycan editing factor PgeF [Agarivorans sp. DSG3-1]|uniref:peptidoglycan editing factor PgeF n=1 Tax=Agarivorans sp. DSG3-1 TaxID=3342249 RepID=UPI00398F6980